MTISVYHHGKTPVLQVGMLRADPQKPDVPLVEDQYVKGEAVPSVYAYVDNPAYPKPGWEWRAATAEEIAASKGNAVPQQPATTATTTAAPVVTTASIPSNDWATLAAIAERSGQMTPELRSAAQKLAAGGTVAPSKHNPASREQIESGWDAALAKNGQRM